MSACGRPFKRIISVVSNLSVDQSKVWAPPREVMLIITARSGLVIKVQLPAVMLISIPKIISLAAALMLPLPLVVQLRLVVEIGMETMTGISTKVEVTTMILSVFRPLKRQILVDKVVSSSTTKPNQWLWRRSSLIRMVSAVTLISLLADNNPGTTRSVAVVAASMVVVAASMVVVVAASMVMVASVTVAVAASVVVQQ